MKKECGKTTPFKSEYCELAFNYCSLGATEKQLAHFFGVDEKELIEWKIKYPKFQNAIKRGEIMADANVASSLYRRAIGYSHPETIASNHQGELIKTEITKHHPPDVRACIYWLSNRQPKIWGNVTGVEFEPNGDID
ncbi:MAG: helix-turn-helix domain-containing protein [Methylococcaceae bacterium]